MIRHQQQAHRDDFGPILSEAKRMSTDKRALERLAKMVPPPASPLELEREPACLTFSDGEPVHFSPDYLALVDTYGSGWFKESGDIGMIAEIHNPRAVAYRNIFDGEHEFLRRCKAEERRGKSGYAAYEIFPASPGLNQWGYAEGRKAYHWLTEGPPCRWPIIVMWEFEFFASDDMSVVEFLEKLLAGELDAGFLADAKTPLRLDSPSVSFVAHATRSR
jgi:hypothetical protein